MTKSPHQSAVTGWRTECARAAVAVATVVLTVAALWAVRLTGPNDLMHRDQERPATYVLDAVVNHHWLVQRDPYGDIASKPPICTWISGPAALEHGRFDRVVLTLPGFLGVLGTALLLALVGGRVLGRNAGFLAAAAFLASAQAAKTVALVRTDGFFAFAVFAAGLLAWRAWRRGRGWTWFWLAACGVTLTKGPQGVAFAALGLLAAFWEARSGRSRPLAGRAWPGALLWLVVCGGWLAAATASAGPDVVHRLLGRELLHHVARGDAGELPLVRIWYPFVSMLQIFFPSSLLLPPALWWASRGDDDDDERRSLIRFCVVWVLGGLLLLGLAGHQRRDLVMPFVPAAALMVGAWLGDRLPRRRQGAAAVALLVLSLVGSFVYYHGSYARIDVVRSSEAVVGLAAEARPRLVGLPPTVYVEAPLTLQVALGTHLGPCPYSLGRLLAEGDDLVALAVWQPQRWLSADTRVLAQARVGDQGWAILTNHPSGDPNRWRASWLEPLVIRWHDLEARDWCTGGVVLAPIGPDPRLEAWNTSEESAPVHIQILGRALIDEQLAAGGKLSWPPDR